MPDLSEASTLWGKRSSISSTLICRRSRSRGCKSDGCSSVPKIKKLVGLMIFTVYTSQVFIPDYNTRKLLMVATRTPKANNITHVEYVEIDLKKIKKKRDPAGNLKI